MSKTWEHSHHAARHHDRAAYQAAARYDQAEEHEKAAHHAYLAHGHNQHAIDHDSRAANLHAEHCDKLPIPASELATERKSAA